MHGTKKSAKTTGSMMDGSDKKKGAKKHPSFSCILTIDKKRIMCYNTDTKKEKQSSQRKENELC